MTTTTGSRIADQARIVAQIIDDGMRVGMPEPASIGVTYYLAPHLMMRTFEEVEQWAAYLEVDAVRKDMVSGDREGIAALADLSDVYGISIEVTTNRAVTR